MLNGATRQVFLYRRYAIKMPSFRSWKLFLCGLLANMQEAEFSKLNWLRLCPVVWNAPLGLMIIMMRATPLTQEEFEKFNYDEFIYLQDGEIPVENKLSSFGWLNGMIVAVDYGS
jgi:hypothetical protein